MDVTYAEKKMSTSALPTASFANNYTRDFRVMSPVSSATHVLAHTNLSGQTEVLSIPLNPSSGNYLIRFKRDDTSDTGWTETPVAAVTKQVELN